MIDTKEGLVAQEPTTVVMDAEGYVFERYESGWAGIGETGYADPDSLMLPCRVLYDPSLGVPMSSVEHEATRKMAKKAEATLREQEERISSLISIAEYHKHRTFYAQQELLGLYSIRDEAVRRNGGPILLKNPITIAGQTIDKLSKPDVDWTGRQVRRTPKDSPGGISPGRVVYGSKFGSWRRGMTW